MVFRGRNPGIRKTLSNQNIQNSRNRHTYCVDRAKPVFGAVGTTTNPAVDYWDLYVFADAHGAFF